MCITFGETILFGAVTCINCTSVIMYVITQQNTDSVSFVSGLGWGGWGRVVHEHMVIALYMLML